MCNSEIKYSLHFSMGVQGLHQNAHPGRADQVLSLFLFANRSAKKRGLKSRD